MEHHSLYAVLVRPWRIGDRRCRDIRCDRCWLCRTFRNSDPDSAVVDCRQRSIHRNGGGGERGELECNGFQVGELKSSGRGGTAEFGGVHAKVDAEHGPIPTPRRTKGPIQERSATELTLNSTAIFNDASCPAILRTSCTQCTTCCPHSGP